MAEIETDKATMEFEAVDEGTIVSIDVSEGSEGVKVGTVIAMIAGEDEDATTAPIAKAASAALVAPATQTPTPAPVAAPVSAAKADRVIASPLAKRIAADAGVDLGGVKGTGPNGRIVKADVIARRQQHRCQHQWRMLLLHLHPNRSRRSLQRPFLQPFRTLASRIRRKSLTTFARLLRAA